MIDVKIDILQGRLRCQDFHTLKKMKNHVIKPEGEKIKKSPFFVLPCQVGIYSDILI